ncbi:MAG TPA: ABC-F family ATP-binding cassette domain-containing protein [Treponema sp.]|nr:ABC-F family ATP-binding cassette domain-containing protein [Treponema sp.]
MAFVQFSQVSLAFGDRDILKEARLNLASGTRAALAGANGSGKTTLMKIISGEIPADSGERAVEKNTRISYLPQSGIVHHGRTLCEEVESAFSRGRELYAQLESLGDDLANEPPDSSKAVRLVEEHHEVQVALEASGWYRRQTALEQTLLGLGFTSSDFTRSVDEFSGGWQMRIALAKVLLEAPDILLLDEPTNYLDIEARNWLESWLSDFSGGYLLVSHDRYFLDVTVQEVYELFGGELKHYNGTYSRYEQIREQELAALMHHYEKQQEEIAKTEDFIRRFRSNASKAAIVQGRIKQLAKVERIVVPENLKKMSVTFPPAPHTGRLVITVTGLNRSYGDRPIIRGFDCQVEKKERLVVVGRNGSGKSTLLRVLAGVDTDYTGIVENGAGVLPGYFSQESAELLTGNESIIEFLEREAPTALIPRLRDMLASFLFRGDDVYKSVSVLSGGEKSRLALLRLLLRPINLLILDEPTNHLDLHSKDVLLEALRKFTGTIVFVSHDRAFIEGLADRVLELTAGEANEPSQVRSFPGDYSYYLDRLAEEAAKESVGQSNQSETGTPASAKSTDQLSRAESRALEKQRTTARRKLEREEEQVFEKIANSEEQKKEQEHALARPEVYTDGEKSRAVQKEIERLDVEIHEHTARWEIVTKELEEYI